MSMTIEQAINVLRNYEDYIVVDCNIYNCCEIEAKLDISIKLAVECMEKSIPKKPMRKAHESYHTCPVCNNYTVDDIDSLFDYCTSCGQRIEW